MSALYIARSTEIAARVLGGEMMIMSARDSTLFNLNDVATAGTCTDRVIVGY